MLDSVLTFTDEQNILSVSVYNPYTILYR